MADESLEQISNALGRLGEHYTDDRKGIIDRFNAIIKQGGDDSTILQQLGSEATTQLQELNNLEEGDPKRKLIAMCNEFGKLTNDKSSKTLKSINQYLDLFITYNLPEHLHRKDEMAEPANPDLVVPPMPTIDVVHDFDGSPESMKFSLELFTRSLEQLKKTTAGKDSPGVDALIAICKNHSDDPDVAFKKIKTEGKFRTQVVISFFVDIFSDKKRDPRLNQLFKQIADFPNSNYNGAQQDQINILIKNIDSIVEGINLESSPSSTLPGQKGPG